MRSSREWAPGPEAGAGLLGEAGEEVCGGLGVGEWLEVGRWRGVSFVVALVVGELVLVLPGGVAVGAFDVVAGAAVGLVEEAGLGLGVAAELVAEEGNACDQHFFEGGLGVELVAEVLDEGGVGVVVGLGDEGLWGESGAEAVGDGVWGDAGFAFGGFGACGFEGVEAVGLELSWGDR